MYEQCPNHSCCHTGCTGWLIASSRTPRSWYDYLSVCEKILTPISNDVQWTMFILPMKVDIVGGYTPCSNKPVNKQRLCRIAHLISACLGNHAKTASAQRSQGAAVTLAAQMIKDKRPASSPGRPGHRGIDPKTRWMACCFPPNPPITPGDKAAQKLKGTSIHGSMGPIIMPHANPSLFICRYLYECRV